MSEGGTPQPPGSPTKTSRSERLPSLKPKRDLTLGGIRKRVFTPTIPARRQKKATEAESKPDDGGQKPKTTKSKGQHKEGQKDKQQRKKKDVITASSVFSMGPGERMIQTRKEMVQFGQRTSSTTHQTPSIKTEGTSSDRGTSDKNDSFELMEVDPSSSNIDNLFMDSIIPPIKLPLNVVDFSHSLPKVKKDEPIVKREPHDDTPSSLPLDNKPSVESSLSTNQSLQVSDIFSPSEDSRGVFLLLQLPDCLPTQSADVTNSDKKGTIRDVSEGMMGAIRVHKSGRVKLALGDIVFDVTMGTRGGFLQEISSIRVSDDSDGGPLSLTVLGQLSHRLVCVPDVSCMMYDDR